MSDVRTWSDRFHNSDVTLNTFIFNIMMIIMMMIMMTITTTTTVIVTAIIIVMIISMSVKSLSFAALCSTVVWIHVWAADMLSVETHTHTR